MTFRLLLEGITAFFSAAARWGRNPLISIERLIGDQGVGSHCWQQFVSAIQIVSLAARQEKADGIADGID